MDILDIRPLLPPHPWPTVTVGALNGRIFHFLVIDETSVSLRSFGPQRGDSARQYCVRPVSLFTSRTPAAPLISRKVGASECNFSWTLTITEIKIYLADAMGGQSSECLWGAAITTTGHLRTRVVKVHSVRKQETESQLVIF